jgi:hypothetical protein
MQTLSLDRLGDEIAELSAHLDAATARLLDLIREFDAREGWGEDARRHASRALHVYQGDDGMMIVRGRLAPEVGAVLVQALAAAREALYQRARAQAGDAGPADVSAETPTMAQQQADALGLLAETALHHGIDPGAAGERYQVVVHVDAPVLADPDAPGESALEDGTHVSAETSRRLACDASRVVMQHGGDGQAAALGSGRAITSVIGPTVAPLPSRI